MMRITPDEFRFCLGKAQWMREQYMLHSLPGDKMPPSVDELLRICRDELDVEAINVFRIPLDGNNSSIRSAFTLSDKGVNIYILEGQGDFWNRYLIAKELFHILLDQDEYRNMDILQHLEEVSLNWNGSSPAAKSVVCEMMAEIAVMEFLFPYECRLQERKTSSPDFEAIAAHYRIPRIHVENYLTNGAMAALLSYMIKEAKSAKG